MPHCISYRTAHMRLLHLIPTPFIYIFKFPTPTMPPDVFEFQPEANDLEEQNQERNGRPETRFIIDTTHSPHFRCLFHGHPV